MFKKDLITVTLLLIASFSTVCKAQHCSSEGAKVTMICSKIEIGTWNIGGQLACYGDKSITSKYSDSSVSEVVHGNKLQVQNLAEITALDIEGAKEFKFIPSGIGSKFANLKALTIHSCGLLSVSKENLKQFGSSLEELKLTSNKLISIDANLFEHYPNLKDIYLGRNPIRHIDPEFFTNLKKLKNIKGVSLDSTKCMNQWFNTASGHNIQTFKWNNEKCTDSSAKVEAKRLISDNICITFDQKLSNLRSEIIQQSARISNNISDSVRTAISALEIKFETSISAQERKITTLSDKTKESVDKLEKSIITHVDKLRTEIEENKETFASTLTEQHGLLSHSIKGLESLLKTSINAQDDKIKTLTDKVNENMQKNERSSVTLLNKSGQNFHILRMQISEIRRDNEEMKKSFEELKSQMAEDYENMTKTLETIKTLFVKNYV